MTDRRPTLWGLDAAFFAPLWRRVVIVALAGGWAIFELLGGSPFWAILFAGVTAVCIWQFFMVHDYDTRSNGAGRKDE